MTTIQLSFVFARESDAAIREYRRSLERTYIALLKKSGMLAPKAQQPLREEQLDPAIRPVSINSSGVAFDRPSSICGAVRNRPAGGYPDRPG